MTTPDEATVAAKAEGFDFPVMLCGHTHIPRAVRLRDGRLIVNPGSVGLQINHGSPDARYATIELRGGKYYPSFHAVPYDHFAAARQAEANGFPQWREALVTAGRPQRGCLRRSRPFNFGLGMAVEDGTGPTAVPCRKNASDHHPGRSFLRPHVAASGEKIMAAGQNGGSGAMTELNDEKVLKNDILSNRDKAQRPPGQSLDSTGVQVDEYKDIPTNQRPEKDDADAGKRPHRVPQRAPARSRTRTRDSETETEVDRPGFDLGGSSGDVSAGKGLGLRPGRQGRPEGLGLTPEASAGSGARLYNCDTKFMCPGHGG